MEFQNIHLFIFVAMAFVTSHAALPAETYWNSVLPNSPMPKAVKDPLQSDVMEDKSISVGVSGGVDVNTKGGNPEGTNVNVGHGGVDVNTPGGTNVNVGRDGVGVNTPGGTNVNVGHGGVGVNTPGGTNVNVGHGGVAVNTPGGTNVNVGYGGVGVNTPGGTNVNVGHGGGGGVETKGRILGGTDVNVKQGGGVSVISGHHRGKPVYVGVMPRPQPFLYQYAASKNQLHDTPNVALFFLENNMTQGSKMNLHFFKTSNGATFLSRKVAESIPFSSKILGKILNKFSVKPDSQEAEIMKKTIKECEKPAIQEEEKFCATSLEAMVDFTNSKLGKNIQSISTNLEKETPLQKYTIVRVKKMDQ